MKNSLVYFFLLFTFSLLSQKKFTKELSFITDNDLYVSTQNDRYYTSGIFLSYKTISKKQSANIDKTIYEWKIGHEMYTPYRASIESKLFHDRPFAGYLYGNFGIHRFYKQQKSLSTAIQIGTIGTNSFAKELQTFVHDIYGFRRPIGWKYQIKNAFALNFSVDYNDFIVKNETYNLDLTWINTLNAGTVYTNVSSGFYARFGFIPLQSVTNSIAFGSGLNTVNHQLKREKESFIFIKPTLRYALYDATIQGSFLNPTSEITKDLNPIVFNIEMGLLCTLKRFNLGYIVNYNTNKSKELRNLTGHTYGRILINYVLY
jgi:hypothetical protein